MPAFSTNEAMARVVQRPEQALIRSRRHRRQTRPSQMWLDLPPGARAWKPRAEVDEARLIRTVDLRTVFATVCDRRPGVDQQAALRSAYETLPIFKT